MIIKPVDNRFQRDGSRSGVSNVRPDPELAVLNSVIRKAIKKRKLFPTDDSARKVIYLSIQAAAKKWTMPIGNWKAALNRFMIEFEDRLIDYI